MTKAHWGIEFVVLTSLSHYLPAGWPECELTFRETSGRDQRLEERKSWKSVDICQ